MAPTTSEPVSQRSGSEVLLEATGVGKSFPGVQALTGVDFTVRRGEVHALLGENGAGKSTLIKILSGVYQKDTGEMSFAGKPFAPSDPRAAQAAGIAVIYQEFNLVPAMSVAENIFLGDEPGRRNTPFVDWATMTGRTRELLAQLELQLDPHQRVQSLGVAQQQLVEVAKALHRQVDLLVMDEPTAALTLREIDHLFAVIERLRRSGVAIVYISHRLEEIFRIADRVTVLRDGRWVATQDVATSTPDALIALMVGRRLENQFPKESVPTGPEVLRVEGLSRAGAFADISFAVRAGEIVGLAGLMGSGRTEVARAIFGADPLDSGEIFVHGEAVTIRDPRDAMRRGIALLTEDRKQQGLVLPLSVRDNTSITVLQRLLRGPFIDHKAERDLVSGYVRSLAIKTPSLSQPVGLLSGGTQQKVVLSKWLATQPSVLIFDEPTRGIDVGAKVEIYRLMGNLAKHGVGIVMISSELPEILGLSDRILVLHQGRLVADMPRELADQETILRYATGEIQSNEGDRVNQASQPITLSPGAKRGSEG
ncbi:MAG: ABC-type sugar transport system, ATPase component [Thermomicrobiales bacterium]|nr:ABC-type sugar transport system, ATPase component [Thermomicrobiales bacterium]